MFSALLWPLDHLLLASAAPVLRIVVIAPVAGLLLVAGIAVVRPDLVRVVIAQLPSRSTVSAIPASVTNHPKVREA